MKSPQCNAQQHHDDERTGLSKHQIRQHEQPHPQAELLRAAQATQNLLLTSIPHTEIVMAENAERLWRERRGLFFKTCTGFGSRASYRGDKLTHRVWRDILAGDYFAQALILPGQRTLSAETTAQVLKFDVRNYAYAGEVMSVAARLYQGQTTNF